jgi:hypothetical protein
VGRPLTITSNGPGELYAWVKPVLAAWRRVEPDLRVSIALVPCQFAGGGEERLARSFDVDQVVNVRELLMALAQRKAPAGLSGGPGALVLGLGGEARYATALAARLGAPAFRYSFEPTPARGLERLFVHDERTRERAAGKLRGEAKARVETVGNLVADAVAATSPTPQPGSPHILLMASSRDAFARHLIPMILGVTESLQQRYPDARFVWPVPGSLSAEALQAGLEARHLSSLGGVGAVREGNLLRTASGAVLEMVGEHERYQHMLAADVALTIPGTNTLELGIAGVPTLMVVPLNRPEIIPLEGAAHWLGVLPLLGTPLKRAAVRAMARRLPGPLSLPNRISGQALVEERIGVLSISEISNALSDLIEARERRDWIRSQLSESMPKRGAAEQLVSRLRTLCPAGVGASE